MNKVLLKRVPEDINLTHVSAVRVSSPVHNKLYIDFSGTGIFQEFYLISYLKSLKSPASPLFTQPFIQAQIKENIKAPRHWPLCGEFTGNRWIPRTIDQ